VTEDLRSAVDLKLAELAVAFPLRRQARVEWRNYRVSAGIAYYRTGTIGLSAVVLITVQAALDTLIHEYAHLMAYERHGRRGADHGAAWRTAMLELGAVPKVRHNYAVDRNRRLQEVGYLCLGCGKTIIRARRLPKRRKYVHADCGGDLKLAYVKPRAEA
jgi:SprT protein